MPNGTAGAPWIVLDPGEALKYFGAVGTPVNVFVPMQVSGVVSTASTVTITAVFPAAGVTVAALGKLFNIGTAVTPQIAVYDTKNNNDPTSWEATAPALMTGMVNATASTVSFTASTTSNTFAIGDPIALLAPGSVQRVQSPWAIYFYSTLAGVPQQPSPPAVGDTVNLPGSSVAPQVTGSSIVQSQTVTGGNPQQYLVYLNMTAFPVGWVPAATSRWPSITAAISATDPLGVYPIANGTYGGPRNVSIQTPYDQWLHALAHEITVNTGEPTGTTPVSLYYYQLYRSPAQPIVAGVEFEASDDLQLVDQQNLSTGAPASTTSQITLIDQSPDAVLGAEIYTAPNSGTLTVAQYAPPAAADLTLANNVALYANFSVPANASLQLVAVSPSDSSTSSSMLPQLQPGDAITITYTPPTSESPVTATFVAGTDFALITSAGSASANINGTVNALCTAINNRGIYTPMTGMIVATPVSTFANAPGSFVIQSAT
jgi:hypothetical protein